MKVRFDQQSSWVHSVSRSGIMDEPKCKVLDDDLHHAVVVVGYGTEKGQDYWIVKNRQLLAYKYVDKSTVKNVNRDCVGINTSPEINHLKPVFYM